MCLENQTWKEIYLDFQEINIKKIVNIVEVEEVEGIEGVKRVKKAKITIMVPTRILTVESDFCVNSGIM